MKVKVLGVWCLAVRYTATVSTARIFQCYNGIDRLADFNDGFDCENALLLIV